MHHNKKKNPYIAFRVPTLMLPPSARTSYFAITGNNVLTVAEMFISDQSTTHDYWFLKEKKYKR